MYSGKPWNVFRRVITLTCILKDHAYVMWRIVEDKNKNWEAVVVVHARDDSALDGC